MIGIENAIRKGTRAKEGRLEQFGATRRPMRWCADVRHPYALARIPENRNSW
jgi:hypothetical protein